MKTITAVVLSVMLLGLAPAAGAHEGEELPPVPEGAGAGRRIVYSLGEQRVWLVEEDETIFHSHLVSGRRGFPRPGAYSVLSRSEVTRNGSVTMRYMVRFARGPRWYAGFHSIPVNRRGRPIQSEADLGKPRSHGCVRQRLADADLLWQWAPIGTPVIVVR